MFIKLLLLLLMQGAGNEEYSARCAGCHGADGRGGERGPAIVLRGRSDQELRDLIVKGIPTAGMPGFEIPEPKLQQLAAFVRSLGDPNRAPAVSTELKGRRSVSFAGIV